MELLREMDVKQRECPECFRWYDLEYVYTEWSERRQAHVTRRTTAAPCAHPAWDDVTDEEED